MTVKKIVLVTATVVVILRCISDSTQYPFKILFCLKSVRFK